MPTLSTRPRITMTPQRAQELLDHRRTSFGAGLGPMSEAERAEVNRLWDTMPGNTCFTDALERIARGELLRGDRAAETKAVKAALRELGVTDRCCVRHHSGVLHVYLSRAVRSNVSLLSAIEETLTRLTGRRSYRVPGRYARYTIQPTYEERSPSTSEARSGEGGR